MVPPVVAFATFQIKTIVPVKPWDRPDPGFNSGLVSVLIHEATVCGGVSQWAYSTAGALVFCVVFVLDFGKNVFPT